ncbi:substrate-binding domain-containing protein [Fodinicola acaciae]|uniref:substrate-binding domain-containing protein n=1 Tax=Fodinicola acaciae TaxID=2681555 RepID=UPI0013D524DD|nr:substrate-binding domain-containing protein [Fodinicola acaciae]
MDKSRNLPRRTAFAMAAALAGSLILTACGSGASDTVGVSLILKTLSNPYFVSMQSDAQKAATAQKVNLTVAAGKTDGDTQTQITAIDNAISRGDQGILITTNGDAVNTELQKARKAGIFVIALDTVPTPPSTVDVTYATDNEQAGKLIGQYAATKLNGAKAVIAMLDLFNNQVVSVDTSRDHGFLEGMGIDPGNKTQNGQEAKAGRYTGGKGGDYTIACHQPTTGAIPGGKTAMENCLSANGDINVVYTINEPAADGALQALKAANKKNVLVLTIDGSCKYVNGLVKSGDIAADSAQYPGKMASVGVQAIAALARGGKKPALPAGRNFIDTGTALVTANPLPGVTSQTPADAAKACWGS